MQEQIFIYCIYDLSQKETATIGGILAVKIFRGGSFMYVGILICNLHIGDYLNCHTFHL